MVLCSLCLNQTQGGNMVDKLVSWGLVGILGYAHYYVGGNVEYIAAHSEIYSFTTLLTIAFMRR